MFRRVNFILGKRPAGGLSVYCSRSQNRTWGGSWASRRSCGAGAGASVPRRWAEPRPALPTPGAAVTSWPHVAQPPCSRVHKLGLDLFVEFCGSCGCLGKVPDSKGPCPQCRAGKEPQCRLPRHAQGPSGVCGGGVGTHFWELARISVRKDH